MIKSQVRNSLKITIRTLRRDLGYSLTSVLGLTVGILCFIFVLLWTSDELKFNNPPKGKKVGLVLANIQQGPEDLDTWITTPYILSRTLQEKYPSIAKATTITWERNFFLKRKDDIFPSKGIFATSEFIDIFNLPIGRNTRELFRSKINAVLITESFASKYFGESSRGPEIVGKELVTTKGQLFEIVGILPDISHSTIKFELVANYDYFLRSNPSLADWDQYSNKTIVELNEPYSFESANVNIANVIPESGPDPVDNTRLFVQPFEDTYLKDKYSNGQVDGGRIEYVRILVLAAGMILVLAIINYIILLTIRSSKRRKEIGVKKILGATQVATLLELVSESFLVFFLSMVFSFVIAIACLPVFNVFTGKAIQLIDFTSISILYFIVCLVIVSLIAGLIPSYLHKVSSGAPFLKPTKSALGGGTLRKSMITAQYALTVILVIGSIIISRQIDYILTTNLGINRDNVFITGISTNLSSQKLQTLKNELIRRDGIIGVSYTDSDPLEVNNEEMGYTWEGMNSKTSEKEINFTVIGADPDFISVLGIGMEDGRNFASFSIADSTNYIINRTAAKAMELADPKDKTLNKGKIIGVLKDFHFKSLYSPIDPLIIKMESKPSHMLIKVKSEKSIEALVNMINDVYRNIDPLRPLDVGFLDDEYNSKYRSEFMIKDLILGFTLISIIISAMGQLSLIRYTSEMRTKEIGIRKVLGASEHMILLNLVSEFLILMLVSLVVSIPLSIMLINSWLNEFAYHIGLNIEAYLVAIAVIVTLTLATVWRTAIHAARQNPVRSLRYE